MELPVSFSEKLTALIGADGYEEYARALTQPAAHGLRANRLKLTPPRLAELLNGSVRLGAQVPWCEDGFYFDTDPERMPGRLAYYLAGLYYIQEPSAMYPAANAGIRHGQCVLDLCAAPGGKSLRAASDLGGAGLLVSNDISASRAGTLLYNLELGGVPNVIVTNSTPAELEARFGAFFDVVLVDAPCSGEGMFRKDPEALASWEKYKTDKCVEMQRGILASAAGLVRPGGRIMYSTCTFDRREDE
ncbi:MAG: RsmB/NOP family class I SAM-dependent RNA methyltransferase [Clostridia bacterium]|nr:RsmB/NOP family class I SAM-dependent RNA methyltransferase [Clostridia bacterium]